MEQGNITIRIRLDDAAIQDGGRCEVGRIVRDVARRTAEGERFPFKLYDLNDNHVGRVHHSPRRIGRNSL